MNSVSVAVGSSSVTSTTTTISTAPTIHETQLIEEELSPIPPPTALTASEIHDRLEALLPSPPPQEECDDALVGKV